MGKRFRVGDDVLIRFSYGSDRHTPYRAVKICAVFYRGVYDYLAVTPFGVHLHLCDQWLVPSQIVISEDIDVADLFADP